MTGIAIGRRLPSSATTASRAHRRWLKAALLGGTALVSCPSVAEDLPSGHNLAAGSVSVSQSGPSAMAIRQSSDRAVLNWDGFSIGSDAAVDVQQPRAGAALLNRVTGPLPSRIDGRLSANGQVFIVNRSGVVVGSGGQVDASAFVASSLDTSDGDFMAGRLRFTGDGSSAEVRNEGTIRIRTGGHAALLGGRVVNTGLVEVPLGKVGFGAGEMATLDLDGDGFLQVAVPSSDDPQVPLIDNSGGVSAHGGTVVMSAATARQAIRHAVNLSGYAEARSVSGRSGHIVLGGGPGGNVTVTGRVDAQSADKAPAASVTITGFNIGLQGARITAHGGGSVRIGGDFHGAGALPLAETVTADRETWISADGGPNGDGGSLVVWADGDTRFFGHVSARGGVSDGDGGTVEVSGKQTLTFDGSIDTSAPNGATGLAILDPTDFLVTDRPSGETGPAPENTIYTDTLEGLLERTNQELATAPSDDNGEGNITIDGALSWSSANRLALAAYNDLVLNAPITAPAGSLSISGTVPDLGSSSDGMVLPSSTADIDVGAFWLTSAKWVQTAANIAGFSADRFSLGENATFLRAQGGTGSAASPYLIGDIYGFQGLDSANLGSTFFRLADDINAAGIGGWNTGTGFNAIGEANDPFLGSLDGDGHVISGLTSNKATGEIIDANGVFGVIGKGGTVSRVSFSDLDISGEGSVGGLASQNAGTISAVQITGNVRGGTGTIGGLVGENTGQISDVSVQVAVSAGNAAAAFGDIRIGGLVGDNSGSIVRSQAIGSVSIGNISAGVTPKTVNLGFGLDESGSIETEDFEAARNALASALSQLPLTGPVSYRLSVVTFNRDAEVVVAPTLLADADALKSVQGKINAKEQREGGTNIGAAVDALSDAFSNYLASELALFNVTTDGAESTPGGLATASKTAATSGVDGLSFLAVGSGAATGTLQRAAFPSTEASPVEILTQNQPLPDPTQNGFVLKVADFSTDFASAISAVVDTTTASTSLSVEAGGLVGRNQPDGTIADSRSLAPVTDAIASTGFDKTLGGISGVNDGKIATSLAAATISSPAAQNAIVGGVSGTGSGTQTATFFDSTLNPATQAGGLPTSQLEDPVAFPVVASPQWDFGSVWAPGSTGFYPAPMSVSPVVYAQPDDLSGTYKSFGATKLTGTLSGGPGTYAFGPQSDAISSDPDYVSDGFPSGDVNSYPITVASPSVTSDQGLVYRVVGGEGTLTISPAGQVVVIADDITKTYGTVPTLTFSVTGLAGDDQVAGVVLTSAGSAAEAPVAAGGYAILPSGVSVIDPTGAIKDQNYAGVIATGGTLTVDPAGVAPSPVVVRAVDVTKTAGQALSFAGTEFTVSGLALPTDQITSASISSPGAAEDAPAGTYPIFITEATGPSAGNYSFTYQAGTLTVEASSTGPITIIRPEVRLPTNPVDTIRLRSGGFAPAGGTTNPEEATSGALDTLLALSAAGEDLEEAVAACRSSASLIDDYLACIAEALDRYAAALDPSELDLPEALEGVSAAIVEARTRIDVARERASERLAVATTDEERAAISRDAISEASAALALATARVEQSLALIRADDPELQQIYFDQGNTIVQTLQAVELELQRATEI